MKLFEVNKNIIEIREHIIPITSTAIGDKYPKIIFDIKHPRAGEIMSFSEATQRANAKGYNLSKSSYYRIRKELENSIIFKQTEPEYAFSLEREKLENVYADLYEALDLNNDDVLSVENLSDTQLIDAVKRAGEKYNEYKKEHKNSKFDSLFYVYLQQELEELLGRKFDL